MILREIISYNFNVSKTKYRNYIHYTIWSQLNFLSECDNFCLLDSIKKNPKNKFMIEIFKNNIIELINYLISENVNII